MVKNWLRRLRSRAILALGGATPSNVEIMVTNAFREGERYGYKNGYDKGWGDGKPIGYAEGRKYRGSVHGGVRGLLRHALNDPHVVRVMGVRKEQLEVRDVHPYGAKAFYERTGSSYVEITLRVYDRN